MTLTKAIMRFGVGLFMTTLFAAGVVFPGIGMLMMCMFTGVACVLTFSEFASALADVYSLREPEEGNSESD